MLFIHRWRCASRTSSWHASSCDYAVTSTNSKWSRRVTCIVECSTTPPLAWRSVTSCRIFCAMDPSRRGLASLHHCASLVSQRWTSTPDASLFASHLLIDPRAKQENKRLKSEMNNLRQLFWNPWDLLSENILCLLVNVLVPVKPFEWIEWTIDNDF